MVSERKLLIWTIATIAFCGGFRIHEILPQNSSSFDPSKTLLGRDVAIEDIKVNNKTCSTLQICLKTEKTRKTGGHTIVDIYENGGDICAVRAFKKWNSIQVKSDSLPIFRDETGKNFTGRRFNQFLSNFTEENFPGLDGKISSHSFRAGLASMLGSMGFSDEEIKATGRWSSKAFTSYLKFPRTQRAEMARKIASMDL